MTDCLITCGHVCCGRPDDPFHRHEVTPDGCESCAGEPMSAPDDDAYLDVPGLAITHPYGTRAL